MEVLVNLIIIFIIVITVLKRIQEVNKKQGEITVPPTSPPVPFPKLTEELKRRIKPVEDEIKPSEEQILSQEDVFEKIQPVFVEPKISIKQKFARQVEELFSVVTEPDFYEKVVPKIKAYSALKLKFSGSELIRGIIMREILGPPVSMQNERW